MEEFAILIHGWFIPPLAVLADYGGTPHKKKIFLLVGGLCKQLGR